MNDTLRAHVEQVLQGLSQGLWLLDARGNSLLPPSPASYYLPEQLNTQEPASLNGYLFLRLKGEEGHILLAREQEGSADLLKLASRALEALGQLKPKQEDQQGAARRLLTGQLPPNELEALIDQHHIPPQLPRCVLLLELAPQGGLTAYQQLRELLPLEDADILTPIDSATVALIKALDRGLGISEPEEFARALQDTLMEETGRRLVCGIGEAVSAADALPQSYVQARQALDIGQLYPLPDQLYVWRRLWLARFMAQVPAETARYYHGLLFNRRTASLFTQEMLTTIEMFLEKDLNLSDTARQLYIHRNTLVYRLDKVQRQSGLDLRRFEDAFVFKLFYQLKALIPAAPSRPQER